MRVWVASLPQRLANVSCVAAFPRFFVAPMTETVVVASSFVSLSAIRISRRAAM